MTRRIRISIIVLILSLALLAHPAVVQAIPPLPSSFYGTVQVNNANVADGTLMEALINGQVYAQGYTQTYQGNSVYTLSVAGDDSGTPELEGGKEGDTIQFKIGGVLADQTGTWHGGTNARLNLSVSSGTPLNTPAPTPTSLPTQTAIPVVPTATPTNEPASTETTVATNEPRTQTAVPTDQVAIFTATAAIPTVTPTQELSKSNTIESTVIIPSATFTPPAATDTGLASPTQVPDVQSAVESQVTIVIILLSLVIISGLLIGIRYFRQKKH